MNYVDIVHTLKKHKVPMHDAKIIASELALKDSARATVRHARDWDRLLSPLIHDIRTKASTMWRWSKDPLVAPVYSAYLQMLRKVRDRIKGARATNAEDKTIPEIARDRNLSGNGLKWQDWVPPKVHTAFLLEFEKLNAHRNGRRMRPFETGQQRTASERRWDILATTIAVEKRARQGYEDTPALYMEALDYALNAVYARDPDQPAPVKWQHLLTPAMREELNNLKKGDTPT